MARRDGVNGAGGVFYYFSDHLKTASIVTDSAGVIKAESDYYPWGGELQFVNNDSNHYKFTGKERDTESGLDYFGARYYSNGLGRWVSADWSPTPVPVPYVDFRDPQTLNLYSFVRATPTTRFDLDGHQQQGRPPAEVEAEAEAKRKEEQALEAKPEKDPLERGEEAAEKEVQEKFASDVNEARAGGYDDIFTGKCYVAPQPTMSAPGGEPAETPNQRDFDAARVEAFKNAGMTDPKDVTFTRVDPKTGTVVEFKGPEGAKVRYDGPHDSPGPEHDQPHISWQSGGKVSEGGRQRGNIPYGGEQHPSSTNRQTGNVEPH